MRSLTVLRLVQEGLANATKHAGPMARIRLWMDMADGTLSLVLENTLPAGAEPPRQGHPGPSGGHGLLGMRERVALVGGTIDAGPAPDGWRIRATLPPMAGGVGP
ncbi:ATP-binding protein [Kitasatospora sp. NPDC001159]